MVSLLFPLQEVQGPLLLSHARLSGLAILAPAMYVQNGGNLYKTTIKGDMLAFFLNTFQQEHSLLDNTFSPSTI